MSNSRFHGYLIKKKRRNKEELAETVGIQDGFNIKPWSPQQKTPHRVLKNSGDHQLSSPGTPILRTRADGRVIYPEGGYFRPEPCLK